jgi:hypothetical protein
MRKTIVAAMLLFSFFSNAQNNASLDERIHIHLDKPVYIAGDTIWFKAYLFSELRPSEVSTNFYLDVLNEEGQLLAQKRYPIFNGTAVGTITLPSDIKEGAYIIRAYTPNILNNDPAYVYAKALPVFNPSKPSASGLPSPLFYFLPENGNLVSGVSNRIAWRIDGSATASPIQVDVMDSKGNKVSGFTSKEASGFFEINPEKDEAYTMSVQFPSGLKKTYTLQAETDINLQLDDNPNGTVFTITANKPSDNIVLTGYMFQYEMFHTPVNIINGKSRGAIPTEQFPSGVLHLVLSDGKKILLDKPVLVNNREYQLQMELKTDTLNTAKKAVNSFSLLLPSDTISGSFSISVTDADKEIMAARSSIGSALLLDESSSFLSIDSVDEKGPFFHSMKWKGGLPVDRDVIDLKAEPQYLRLSGKLSGSGFSVSELNLQLDTKDSSTTSITLPVNKEGFFERDNLIYYDTAIFSFNQTMVGEGVTIQPMNTQGDYSRYLARTDYTELVAQARSILANAEARQKAKQVYEALAGSLAVSPAKKSGSKSKPKNDVNSRYTKGLFSGSNSRSVDLVTHPPSRGAQNIFEYLQGDIAGLRIERQGGGYVLWSNRSPSTLEALRGNSQGSVPVKIFLNESEVPSTQVSSIPVSQIALVKYFSPGNIMLPGIGLSGVFAVYTKKPEDNGGMQSSFAYPGYSAVHNFQVPVPGSTATDKRTTIFWEPNLTVQPGTNNFHFSFLNTDEAKRFHVVVQGFTTDGRLIYIDRIIESKDVKAF